MLNFTASGVNLVTGSW